MGCGSICGNSTSIHQVNLKSGQLLRVLVPKIKPNGILLTKITCQRFLKDLEFNSFRYILKGKQNIEKNQPVPSNIMQKWKVILFGLDSDYQMYVNCLGYSKKNVNTTINNQNKHKQPHSIQDELSFQTNAQPLQQIKQLPHPCFTQIEKDLDRTFQLPNLKRQSFKRVLKRIANHFPKMGYTQGINFIVGYFLIIGYSQSDAFWLFAHIALNRKYMLLGLFEDGFPLSTVYICVFKNVLKRKKPELYNHFYEKLMINDSLWIFKWFITYYLYSFPLEMCKYVWDLVIGQGGVGLINFAIGIVSHLQFHLLQLNDDCQISQFFFELKDIQKFNAYVKINEVLIDAYNVTLLEEDLKGIDYQRGGIYAKYFQAYLKKQIKQGNFINPGNSMYKIPVQKDQNKDQLPKGNTASTQFPAQHNYMKKQKVKKAVSILFDQCQTILQDWYKGLIRQRQQFIKTKGITNFKSNKIKFSENKSKKRIKASQNNKLKNFDQQIDGQSILFDQSVQGSNIKEIKHKSSIQDNIKIKSQQLSGQLRQLQRKIQKSDKYDNNKHQNQEKSSLSHRSSYKNIHKRHHVNANIQIHQIWDEQQDIINESRDKITDMEYTTQNFNGIRRVKIDLDNQFSDYQDDQHQLRDQFHQFSVRKRSGSKISIKPKQGDYNNKNKFISNNHINPDSNLRNKVKTQAQIFQQVKKHKPPQSAISQVKHQNSDSKKSIGRKIISTQMDLNHKTIAQGKSSGSDNSNKNSVGVLNNNRFIMAGKSIMSSMSISNASVSNKSSTSSKNNYNKKQKQNGVNININFCSNRYCGCNNKMIMTDDSLNKHIQTHTNMGSTFQHHRGKKQINIHCRKQTDAKQKQDCHNVEEYQHEMSQLQSDRSVDKSFDKSIDMDIEDQYHEKITKHYKGEILYSNSNIPFSQTGKQGNKKWVNFKHQDLANSHGPNGELMMQSNSKNSASQVQIMDGGHLFKKKNKISSKIGGGVSVLPHDQLSVNNQKRGYSQAGKKNHEFTPNYQKISKQNSLYRDSNLLNQQLSIDNGSFINNLNLNRLDQEQSCQSLFIPGFSQGKQSVISGGKTLGKNQKNQNFQIQSVK